MGLSVVFDTGNKEQNRFTMEVEDHGRIYFQKGAFITSDKDLIKKLIQHPLAKRGEYQLVTNKERVAQYLEGEEPDTLTEEILDSITLDGIVEIGKALGASQDQPKLLKIELEGEPITDEVQRIIDFYQREKPKAQVEEETKEKEDNEVDEIETKKSGDMKAKEAIEYIEKAPREDLKNFLSEDEERVTVTEAYNDKMN